MASRLWTAGTEFAGQLEIPTTSEQQTRPERHRMCEITRLIELFHALALKSPASAVLE